MTKFSIENSESLFEELKDCLLIDKSNLDEEVTMQPELFYRVSELYSYAVSQKDFFKEDLSKVDAEVSHRIRHEHDDGKLKLTEAKLSQLVLSSDEHAEAFDNLIQSKLFADRLKSLQESFQQRASMLKIEADLFVSGYFSDAAVKPSTKAKAVSVAASESKKALNKLRKDTESLSIRKRSESRQIKPEPVTPKKSKRTSINKETDDSLDSFVNEKQSSDSDDNAPKSRIRRKRLRSKASA